STVGRYGRILLRVGGSVPGDSDAAGIAGDAPGKDKLVEVGRGPHRARRSGVHLELRPGGTMVHGNGDVGMVRVLVRVVHPGLVEVAGCIEEQRSEEVSLRTGGAHVG